MEPSIIGYITTGIVSLIVGLLLQRFQSKPKLFYWLPGSFIFELKDPKITIRTDSLTIQNIGRKPAKNVEIVHKYRPDHFQFSTAIAFSEKTNPNDEHIIKIPSLGAKEFVNIQFLSHIKQPILLNVRSDDLPAQLIQVHLQRTFPKWVHASAGFILFLGLGFALYWIIRSIIFLSESIGVF
ncbi:conserved hypothetical protein [Candidatus Desulfarcum epimagneticum]|uniref:Uncharacterized protein n=1 Tax=uncultured Desulfobacteraceae bacterium TaxID=218296 RepID=A0A484HKY6_9BACT|nr:conserved hypothetical protein [uncultured Desulfobacteraceae bacterium]